MAANPVTNQRLMLNTGYNLLGQGLPLVVTIVSVPILIHKMGLERYGILAIAWTVIGYFGLFNFGIGRATTKYVAEYLALNKMEELPSIVWTSILLLFGLGFVGGLAAYLTTPLLVQKVLNIPPSLHAETIKGFYLMATSLPFIFASTGACGVLEAQQRFALINAIRIPASLCNYLAPLLVLVFTNSIYALVGSVVVTRLLGCAAFFFFSLKSLQGTNSLITIRLSRIKDLFCFGGWLTVSNIIGPIMDYMDRFFIGALLTMAAVAYYVTPFSIAINLLIIPSSLVAVLFPAFSGFAASNRDQLAKLRQRAVKYIFLTLFPIIICMVIMAHDFLFLWLGPEFARVSAPILQLLAIGVFINGLAWVPFSAIQAMGRPDLTAKLHLLELPLYLGFLWFSIKTMGLIGVALAWVLRASLDAGLLFFWANRLMPERPEGLFFPWRRVLWGVAIIGILAFLLTLMASLPIKIVALPVIIIGFGAGTWRYLLNDAEKEQVFLTKGRLIEILGVGSRHS